MITVAFTRILVICCMWDADRRHIGCTVLAAASQVVMPDTMPWTTSSREP